MEEGQVDAHGLLCVSREMDVFCMHVSHLTTAV